LRLSLVFLPPPLSQLATTYTAIATTKHTIDPADPCPFAASSLVRLGIDNTVNVIRAFSGAVLGVVEIIGNRNHGVPLSRVWMRGPLADC